jgi:hypothetical protein
MALSRAQLAPAGDPIPSRSVTAAQRGTKPVNLIDDVVDEWGGHSFRQAIPVELVSQ